MVPYTTLKGIRERGGYTPPYVPDNIPKSAVYRWFMGGLSLVHGRFIAGSWAVYRWFMVSLSLVHELKMTLESSLGCTMVPSVLGRVPRSMYTAPPFEGGARIPLRCVGLPPYIFLRRPC